ncbi:hypothetical protein [Paucisalibacillus globulus]|uniref:hypothetical protein n=1 Tax=Paucisalibacillus globulus TaxID=351095 RepID=UPI000BB7C5F2|nr:hypothetical protein [Paucisalibacillus globulus]
MKKRKLRKFALLTRVLLSIVIIVLVFDISFSLPTTFREMIVEQIIDDEQLVITELDTERINYITIQAPDSESSGEREEIKIEDKDIISTLLSNQQRIRKNGRFQYSNDTYELTVHFYGTFHRYTIGKDHIGTFEDHYNVLDEENAVYDYISSLFE